MRFFRVKNGETVYYGKEAFVKLSFCTAAPFGPDFAYESDYVVVNPFRRVRTAKRVKQIRVSDYNIQGTTTGRPGGHHELPKAIGSTDESNNAKP